jgi:hypothetical protein
MSMQWDNSGTARMPFKLNQIKLSPNHPYIFRSEKRVFQWEKIHIH